jgi:hypothetical protein
MSEEPLSEICQDLYQFMSGLDGEGLHWDREEALQALKPVQALELRAAQLQHKLNKLRSKLLDVLGEAAVDGPFVVGDPAAGGIRPACKDPSP